MRMDKAGTMVDEHATVNVLVPKHPYVSRGGLKLEAALDGFSIDPTGQIAIDVGASTGGFTDVLLQRGAKRVYSVDVGYGQLAWKLRQDERVVVLERENIRHLDPEKIPDPCDLAVIDVSFISLTKVLPPVQMLLRDPRDKPIVALVKPQFELAKDQVDRGGVVRDEVKRRSAVEKVVTWAAQNNFCVEGDLKSPITGPAGNIEYLVLLRSLRA